MEHMDLCELCPNVCGESSFDLRAEAQTWGSREERNRNSCFQELERESKDACILCACVRERERRHTHKSVHTYTPPPRRDGKGQCVLRPAQPASPCGVRVRVLTRRESKT